MPFIKDILRHRSLSIVGLEKNTGKTVCLNYVLHRLHQLGVAVAVTSIGVDGEQTDAVYATSKPEITLFEGTHFVTSERHYLQRQLISTIVDVDSRSTALGRLVTGRVLCQGKVLLSGAATTDLLRQQIAHFRQQGVPLTIIDGALSRLSLASPTVTEAMVLATGGAVSTHLPTLINKTRFVMQLIGIDSVDDEIRSRLSTIAQGMWAVSATAQQAGPRHVDIHDLNIKSAFLLSQVGDSLYRYGSTFFVAGAVTDRLLKYLTQQRQIGDTLVIVRDFTKLFLSPTVLNNYLRHGGQLRVLHRSTVVAVCLNPTSPSGYRLNSEQACDALSQALQCPVYDIKRIEQTPTTL